MTSKRSLTLEWLCVTLGLLALVLWLSGPHQLPRTNLWLQDLALSTQSHTPSSDVVLVVADERSMASIGRWPWRRALHAHVVTHISAGQPQSIGLDFLLAEPDLDYPEDDLVLAQALARSGRVVLPVVRGFGEQSATLPLPAFSQAAARLGHVHVALDADGGVRSFYAHEGAGQQPWLHLALSMRCIDSLTPACTATSHMRAPAHAPWQRDQHTYIAFAKGQPPFTMYSYIDVLRGQIPASAFRNKHVLIGTAATGIGTAFATPSNPAQSASHNVELIAHVLSGELQGLHAASASSAANHVLNLLPVALALLALLLLGPSAALLVCIALAALTLVVHMLAPAWWHIVFSPAAALMGLLLAYPIWSWRRLNAAARFLKAEMQGLHIQGLQANALPMRSTGDFLQQRIDAVEQASQQLRQLHQFVTETLLQLPSPTLACDHEGRILLANSAAHRYAQSLGRHLQEHQPIADLLEGAVQRGSLQLLWDKEQPPPARCLCPARGYGCAKKQHFAAQPSLCGQWQARLAGEHCRHQRFKTSHCPARPGYALYLARYPCSDWRHLDGH